MGADNGPKSAKRYPYRHPQRGVGLETAGNRRLCPCGRLICTQFSSKRRSRSSAAPIGEAGTRPHGGMGRRVLAVLLYDDVGGAVVVEVGDHAVSAIPSTGT